MTLETWADETRQAIQDEQSAKLRTELEQLRGECALLKEIANTYLELLLFDVEYGDSCHYRTSKNQYEELKVKLTSSSLSEKYAAVVRLSAELRDAMKATEASSGMSSWSLVDRENCLFEEWKAAVDALQEATK